MKPITSWLPELSDGVMIVVQGNVETDEDGECTLDFGHSKQTATALRICLKFMSQIELSLQVAEGKGFSCRRGFLRTGVLRFEVIVLVSDGNFKISLNGCHVCEAPYDLIPLKEINLLEVTGNVLLHRIFCQRPCHADQQVNGDHRASKTVPAGSVVHNDRPDPEISLNNSKPAKDGHLNASSAGTDALSRTTLSKSNKPSKLQESNASEADQHHQHSDADLSGGCLDLGLSTGDTPKSDTVDALDAACWSSNPSPPQPGQAERPGSHMASESLQTLTPSSERIDLPYDYPSPEAPAAAAPHPPVRYELAQNPLVPHRQDAPHHPAPHDAQFRNPVMVDPSNTHPPYHGPMPNQNPVTRGPSNAPYPYPGYAYQQNPPVIPGTQWNAPYPLPCNTYSQHPAATCQPAVPLPEYRYPGYTPTLYPPLPTGSAAPYLHSGHETLRMNIGMPSYGSHPPFNPEYSAVPPYPTYNQQPGMDAMRPPNWAHSNMKFFPEGLRLNQVIKIHGEFLRNPSGFSVYITNGETEEANVFLNMVVSFPDRMVTRTRKMYNRWSPIENSLSHFPFQAGKPFHVAIVCYYNLFRVLGNEAHLFDFQATMNLSEITSVKVFGMVSAVNIAVS